VPQRRRKYETVAGLAVYAVFLVAAIAWLALYQFPQSSTGEVRGPVTGGAGEVGRYGATILMRGGAGGGCRQMKFDNGTGAIQEGAVVPCTDGTPGTNSTEGRMNAIRGAFSKK
jgi:hypothetical protein